MLNAAELIGKVVDATGGPLHSTTVELRREGDRAVIRSFFTDHSGVFRFTDLNVGTYQLAFSCPGFHLAELTRTVSQEERVALLDTVLQLAPIENCVEPDWGPPGILSSEIDSGTELTGKAEEHGGTPIREALVILTDSNNSYRTSSGPTGAFQFSNVKPGVYTLRVRHGGFVEFVVDEVEIRNRRLTAISDTLLLPRCPTGVKCQPVRNTLKVRVCL